jgi:hypothetical protein
VAVDVGEMVERRLHLSKYITTIGKYIVNTSSVFIVDWIFVIGFNISKNLAKRVEPDSEN